MSEREDEGARARGLFVSFEGLPPTIADSQVLLHLREMRRLGVEMELWAFAPGGESLRRSRERERELARQGDLPVRVLPAVRPGFPLSEPINAIRLHRLLSSRAPEATRFVHARTDYAAAVCGLLRPFREFGLIWDCRGDTQAEFRLEQSSGRAVSALRAPYQRLALRGRAALAGRWADRAIFVSEGLERRKAPPALRGATTVIPCAASGDLFGFDAGLRSRIRRLVGVDDVTRLIVYSGSMSAYQSFPACLELFARLYARDPRLSLLVLTPYLDAARSLTAAWPALPIRLIRADFEDVNGYLNAADYGLFLRERNDVNDVASPVKFAEYCMAGLPVIMTDAVEQSHALSSRFGNGIYYDFRTPPDLPEPFDAPARAALSEQSALCLSREAIAPRYVEVYEAAGGAV